MSLLPISNWEGASGGTQDNYPELVRKCKHNFAELDGRAPGSNSVVLHDDFTSDTLDAGWNVVEGTDSATSVHALDANDPNGVIRFTTGDAGTGLAADLIQITRDLHWRAEDGGLEIEARFSLSAITTCYVFFGFTDVVTLEGPIEASGSGNGLTSNASDAVGVLFDTRMTDDKWWLVGVDTDVDATAQNSTYAPVAATYEVWKIAVSSAGVATFYRNGTQVGTAMTASLTPSVSLTPTFAVSKTSVAASMTADVDYIRVSKERV